MVENDKSCAGSEPCDNRVDDIRLVVKWKRNFRLNNSCTSTRRIEFGRFEDGAARDVVGIRRGAISGNMKVSFQAARSIG